MEKYVNIMLDSAFKTVFGVKQVAIDFINAALEGEHQVKDLTYLDKEIQPEVVEQRTVIFFAKTWTEVNLFWRCRIARNVISLTADSIIFVKWSPVREGPVMTGSTACFRCMVSTC